MTTNGDEQSGFDCLPFVILRGRSPLAPAQSTFRDVPTISEPLASTLYESGHVLMRNTGITAIERETTDDK